MSATNRQKKSQSNSTKSTNHLLNGISKINDERSKVLTTQNKDLNQTNKKNKKKVVNQSKPECTKQKNCVHCLNQREIGHVQLEENQLLWSELREHILYMYKISRDQNLGPTIIDRIKFLVDTLCTKDIHQLFIRLELLATDVIKSCLETVERIFVNEIRSTTIAYNYLENIITDCDNYLFAARKMLPILKNLEAHLKKFNICWLSLHQNLFRLHYLDDKRCKLRAKKAKLLLLTDIEVPAFTETILKFSQFSQAFSALSDHWKESTAKILKYRESKQVYKNYQHFLNESWQNFNIHKKNKSNNENHLLEQNRYKCGNKIIGNQSKSDLIKSNQNLTKKARRKAKGDHSRQPSADLMPPPPPRVHSNINNINTFRLDCNKDQTVTCSDKLRKTATSATWVHSKRSRQDDERDLDDLVAFVEGLNITNNKNVDEIENENKRRRKKQKKEKQRLKKMQQLLEQDQVAQLIRRSPGVTITMVNSDHCGSVNSLLDTQVNKLKSSAQKMNTLSMKSSIPSPIFKNKNHSIQMKEKITSKIMPTPIVTTIPATKAIPSTVIAPQSQSHTLPLSASSTSISNPGSRMVTIRRITEGNTDEPTVTITLKGPTPDQDQVLYRIINGQADYGHLADTVLNKKSDLNSNSGGNTNTQNIQSTLKQSDINNLVPISKKQRKKLKTKENNCSGHNDVTIEAVQMHSNQNKMTKMHSDDMVQITKTMDDTKISKKIKNKKIINDPIDTAKSTQDKKIQQTHLNQKNQLMTDNKNVKNQKPMPVKLVMKSQQKSTDSTSVSINNKSIQENNKNIKKPKQKNFETKKSYVNELKLIESKNNIKNKSTTIDNKQKDQYNNTLTNNGISFNNNNNINNKSSSSICHKKPQTTFNSTKIIENSNYKLIPENLRLPAGITITKVPPNNINKKIDYDNKTKHKSDHINDGFSKRLILDQIRTKTDAGVNVLLEKPSFQSHLDIIGDFVDIKPENRQPPIGTRSTASVENDNSCDAPAKFIRAADGRIIIRSPMARSTTPPLNPITMIRQDLEMGIQPPSQTTAAAAVSSSQFWNRNDWWLPGTTDNVFAPKDIDLEDNTLDAEERELEAFKRFCQEPVPPQRQEVTHLNVQKIIIKKNHHS